MAEVLHRSENDLLVFISSRMTAEMKCAREIAVEAIESVEFGRPWAFEYSPASSESAGDSYLRKVREADFVVWLVGRKTTQPVIKEINEAIGSGRRLLAFKLPSDKRDCNTLNLIEQVGGYAKWQDVASVEELSEHITKSVADEIVRGLRDPSPPSRASKLRQDHRLSVSRCKDDWVSLGIEEHIALQMAEECALGDVLETPLPGMHAIVDAQGSGKTLAVERLFQRAINDALEDASQPFPVFVSAREMNEPVRGYVERSLQGNADPFDPRVLLIVDGVDELGSGRALDVYHQIKVYVDANQRATIISTARTLPGLEVMGEELQLNRLTEEESFDLIARVSGHVLKSLDTYRWPNSIRDAMRLPLFALMIGSLLRDNPRLTIATPGQVIERLANRALQQVQGNSEELDRLLQELAVKSTDDGTRVRLSSITPVLAKQRLLRDSRLIEQFPDTVDFTLPIFREWYAARALIEGTISVDHLQQNSDRWLPSLSVVLNSEHDELRTSLMAHMISTDAGLASLLMKEHNQNFMGDEWETLDIGTGEAAGIKIRQAMTHWKAGLGDLFEEIGPVGRGGEVATLGVELSDQFLITSWYAGESVLPPVVSLSGLEETLRPPSDWPTISSASLSQQIRDPFWWSYVETLRELCQSLSDALHRSSLVICSRDAHHELSWDFVSGVVGRNRPPSSAFELDVALATIEAFLKVIESYGPNTVVRAYGGRSYEAQDLQVIAEHLSELANHGADDIQEPWPSSDLPRSPGYVWNHYSDQRLLERTIAIYSGALRIYSVVVERWFACFASRLALYRLLPVRLEGWLTTCRQLASPRDWPFLTWYGRILPPGRSSEVAFELAPSRRVPLDSESLFEQEQHAFRTHRQSLPGEFSLSQSTSSLRSVFESNPATELALEWLRRDLQALGWDLRP